MIRAVVRKESEFYTKTNVLIALCSGCISTLLFFYFTPIMPLWGLALSLISISIAVLHHLASVDEVNSSRKELHDKLVVKSKEYLIAYSQSPELKIGEREIALQILNDKYQGWSLGVHNDN
ncbi:hypothetical protein IB292_03285 [Vibrio parahaemolyticus]|uniref:Uncharacterized protein n=1 Tax=Vibrio parahaemolyticus TaxID=670 RepID=A0A9Q3YG89_VIBPH|nr:hypothetical protein [Vibrio parahaemolyticus]MCC3804056.1 hypothetical protein [Vibrio parahaemolyticus]